MAIRYVTCVLYVVLPLSLKLAQLFKYVLEWTRITDYYYDATAVNNSNTVHCAFLYNSDHMRAF